MVASIGLRLTPPDETVATISSFILFVLPIYAIVLETPIVDELRGGYKMLTRVAKVMPKPRKKPAKAAVAVSTQPDGGAYEETLVEEMDGVSPP